ncbi:MAG: LysM peptidoglycan-binding domain-containing protein [Proteobacteria bacterium]|nr:LysM peptidoglycan-binding domain-containing protein [Pseudomonadota bacterium]
MNHSPRTGSRLARKDRPANPDQSFGNSVHYNCFQGVSFVAALVLGALLSGCATQPEPQPAPPAAQPAPVEKPRAPVELAPRAPERYVVKKGDTLWDISTMFLEDPWLWPEIWYTNPQIENPHLIYPGDIITIFWKDGRPHLQISRDGEIYQTTLPIQRLSPRVRTSPLTQAIPTIPLDAIRPFLGGARVVDKDDYEDLPYLLRSRDGRLLSGAGDDIYARGLVNGGATRFNVIRIGDEYVDPETNETLGYEAIEVGQAVVLRHGDPATLRLEATSREAMKGDRLVPIDESEFNTNFIPTPPDVDINGQIIDVVDGVSQIGQFQIVTLNRGDEDGLEIGNVLAIYQRGETIDDDVGGGWTGGNVKLPDQRAGLLLVFRTFDKISYGLVLHASSEIHLLDMVRNP